jgi:hypothetical protein
MQWPVWIPYPQSWLRTFGLMLWLSLIARITLFWGRGIGFIAGAISGHMELLIIAGLVALIIPFVALTYLHHLLWGKPSCHRPSWLAGRASFNEGAYALIVVFWASVISLAFTLPLVDWEYVLNNYESTSFEGSYYNHIVLGNVFGAAWIASAAYIYHIRHLLRKRRKPSQCSQLVTPRSSQPKVDEIDVELNQLRGQLGLHKMKTPKRSNPKSNK